MDKLTDRQLQLILEAIAFALEWGDKLNEDDDNELEQAVRLLEAEQKKRA